MQKAINKFIRRNYFSSFLIGFTAVIGGIGLAYLTNDAEPWGTIGGFISDIGLVFLVYAGTTKHA